MYEEKMKYLDEAIDKLRKEADAMNGVFSNAVVVALILFLLFAIPDIAAQWRKGLPDEIAKIEAEQSLLEANYRSAYRAEWACLTKDEKEASSGLTEQQKQANRICNLESHLRMLRPMLFSLTRISEMRLSQEKGELLVKLVPALILAVFAGSLLNYRHLKSKEVELILKRVELTANAAPPPNPLSTGDQEV